jgi:hypothetical protein
MIKAQEFPALDSIQIIYIPDYQLDTAAVLVVNDSDILSHDISNNAGWQR